MLKKIIRNSIIKSLLSWLISLYLKLCYHTSIWLIKDNENVSSLIKANKNFIVCFWHGRLLMTPFCWNYEKNFFMLISGHPDGQIISKAVSYFGIKTIVGSSFNNKYQSLRNILKEIKSNNIIGMTPDGPRGPRGEVKDGMISLSLLSKTPVIPLSFSAKYSKELSSWDKFLFVFPFNKFVAVWGKPIYFEKEKLNINKKKLEDEINRVTKLSDNLVN
ncbi:lysophospholipid acyltransferase family protein [Rickettsiales bacterium]|nr:lysophospholipid acyltransferase family protein [Rickettsiales bacterium]